MRANKYTLGSILTLLLAIPITGFAQEGANSGGGGGYAVVCRSPDQKIKSAQLLDLYEAQHKYHFQLPTASGEPALDNVIYWRNLERLSNSISYFSDDDIKIAFRTAAKNKEYTYYSFKNKVKNAGDIGNTIPIPKACNLEPVAYFDDVIYDKSKYHPYPTSDFPYVVSIDQEIWDSFDSLNKKALKTHEWLYRFLRYKGGEHYYISPLTTSEYARSLVAAFFSVNTIPPVDLHISQLKQYSLCLMKSPPKYSPSYLKSRPNMKEEQEEYKKRFPYTEADYDYLHDAFHLSTTYLNGKKVFNLDFRNIFSLVIWSATRATIPNDNLQSQGVVKIQAFQQNLKLGYKILDGNITSLTFFENDKILYEANISGCEPEESFRAKHYYNFHVPPRPKINDDYISWMEIQMIFPTPKSWRVRMNLLENVYRNKRLSQEKESN